MKNKTNKNLIEWNRFNPNSTIDEIVFTTENEIKQFLKEKYSKGYHFGKDELLHDGVYKEMGIEYNFRPYLKKYLCEYYGHLQIAWGPDKSSVQLSLGTGKNEKVFNFPKN